MKSYDTQEVAELSGLAPAQVRALARAGLIGRRARGRYRFGFQDLVLARTAGRLLGSGVRLAATRRALQALAGIAGDDLKATAVRVHPAGGEVVVEDQGHAFALESGQGVLDFTVASVVDAVATEVVDLNAARSDSVSADEWYDIGCDFEEAGSLEQARSAYERALRAEPGHADAHVNLGRLDADARRTRAAERHYRAAVATDPSHELAWFNLGVLLEDANRKSDAITAYREAIGADPEFADAHYNLSRLLEASDRSGAFRHLSAYRRLTGGHRPGHNRH